MRQLRGSLKGELWGLMTAGLLLSTLLGCHQASLLHLGARESPPHVGLGPGDVIEIKFFYTPELNEMQMVRPDGKIALQLVGEVDVQGKTPAELQQEFLNLYEADLRDPEITVIVRSFIDRRVFVGGQVKRPGVVEMPGQLTALEAVIRAGGFDMTKANVRNVIVIRHKGDKRHGYSLNLESALASGATQPFYLEPQDIVYVARTTIAKLDQWIDQYMNQIVPQVGLVYSVQVGNAKHPATIGVDTSAR